MQLTKPDWQWLSNVLVHGRIRDNVTSTQD